ncbi:SusD/RagB family nutrient-binding outer membrane lipoprotein [Zhouia spongiae]|uniref:SusD/RagB family nutrient-binding outer membrane lipoprotein n=1 Tax=Zhouia spongiae TaxID=2202721 RepID=A0ABY3YRS7_9FLAO|nr:SusD/RagB family nutrient-binding outer membrane lipoprotein [Zhouia spongiae]UNZ00293.1 SusD/RagB family nutrient-binding outer membrane lipoprotein [Zhouia spongiae]
MKSIFKKRFLAGAAAFLCLFSCADLDKINTNPDGINTVSSQMLATKLILDITRTDISSTKGFMRHFMLDKYILWSEFAESPQYNDLGRVGFGTLPRLIDAAKMMEIAEASGIDESEKNSYLGLAHFIRAYNFFYLTIKVGDIPYSEALMGEDENHVKPKYDTQKEVFLGILDELEQADQLFANGSSFDGDIIYDGNPVQWRKMVNSFALQVLINLYKKEGDSDLQVKQRFSNIVAGKPIFESNDDNFSLVYSDVENQKYPFFKDGNQFTIYPVVSSVLIDKLKELNDYRLFYYAAPSSVKLEGGQTASDFDAYVGVDPAIEYSALSAIASSKDYSDINDRYKELPEGEPVYLLSNAQVQFILAEAAVRGWISGDAETYYSNGIKSAMRFVADNTPDDVAYHHGMPMDDSYIESYPETPEVKFASGMNEQIEQIITQKYLSTFLQSPENAFFENRRTGYPGFPINPATNENLPSDKLPVRWMYDSDEVRYNKENLDEAVNRQYNGVDDNNGIMWILQ